MKTKIILLSATTILLTSCVNIYTYKLKSYENDIISVIEERDSTILKIIKPYSDSLETKMNEILSYTKTDLIKGKPESKLGNFVSDLCLHYTEADICMLNNGGLRNSLYEGVITKRDIYKLMPFDNELVIVELYEEDFKKLLNYISKKGGVPISGMKLTINKKGDVLNYNIDSLFYRKHKIKVLTSDYLANGGDKMDFFKKKNQIKTGIKVRDAIIDYCKNKDTIDVRLDKRINIIKND